MNRLFGLFPQLAAVHSKAKWAWEIVVMRADPLGTLQAMTARIKEAMTKQTDKTAAPGAHEGPSNATAGTQVPRVSHEATHQSQRPGRRFVTEAANRAWKWLTTVLPPGRNDTGSEEARKVLMAETRVRSEEKAAAKPEDKPTGHPQQPDVLLKPATEQPKQQGTPEMPRPGQPVQTEHEETSEAVAEAEAALRVQEEEERVLPEPEQAAEVIPIFTPVEDQKTFEMPIPGQSIPHEQPLTETADDTMKAIPTEQPTQDEKHETMVRATDVPLEQASEPERPAAQRPAPSPRPSPPEMPSSTTDGLRPVGLVHPTTPITPEGQLPSCPLSPWENVEVTVDKSGRKWRKQRRHPNMTGGECRLDGETLERLVTCQGRCDRHLVQPGRPSFVYDR